MAQYLPPGWLRTEDGLARYVQHVHGQDYLSLADPVVEDVAETFRGLLVEGLIRSCLFDEETGRRTELDRTAWAGSKLWEAACPSMNLLWDADGAFVYGKPLLLEVDLEKHFAEQASAPAETEKHTLGEHSAYLPYMLEVSERFDLKPGYKFHKQRMIDWIIANPPPGMREIKPSTAGSIALLLRDPHLFKPGNHKANPDRPADPCADYAGVKYPKAPSPGRWIKRFDGSN